MFLKNKNIVFKIRRSKVTDYAALKFKWRFADGPLKVVLGSYKIFRHYTEGL